MGGIVIGISPGTRCLGVAILRNGKLDEWKIHSFPQAWSNGKLKSILKCIKGWLKKNNADAVAIKIPDELPISKSYIQLVRTLNRLFTREECKIFYYSLSDLKTHWCKDGKVSKVTLIECLTAKYQELLPEYHTGINCKTAYYHKLFEAVAAAQLAHHEVIT
jgi:hypothetical protein